MRKVWLVASREYRSTVKRKGFIIATLGMPVFFAFIMVLSAGIGFFTFWQGKSRTEVVGVVDESGLVRPELLPEVLASTTLAEDLERVLVRLPEGLREQAEQTVQEMAPTVEVRFFPSRQEAAAESGLSGYYVIPFDYLEHGRVELILQRAGFMTDDRPGWRIVWRLMAASMVEGRVDKEMAQRIWLPARVESTLIGERGEVVEGGPLSQMTEFLVPYLFTILFVIAIMTSAGYLLQGVAEEKENRVIEVLLSSVTSNQLLAGKVVGLCGAGLTQIVVWIVIGLLPAMLLFPYLELNWGQVAIAMFFFFLGFLLFGTLMGGIGALGNNLREGQQMAIAVTMTAVFPLFFISFLLAEPNGTLARLLSFLPLTAPVTMILRASITSLAWWEVLVSAGILTTSLFILIRLAAKIFHLGVLMYGKRPSVFEVVRWLRAA